MSTQRERLRETILRLVRARGPGRTICPSEAARDAAEEWRELMPLVREVAVELAEEGRIAISQRGRRVDPRDFKGPIRLGSA